MTKLDHGQRFVTKKRSLLKNLNIFSINNVNRPKFQHVVHLCKSIEHGTLIYKYFAVSEVTIEKYEL